MQVLHCRCGQRVFFDNDHCIVCGRGLGFAPWRQRMVALDGDTGPAGERRCRNAIEHQVCNWLIEPSDPGELCASCRLNRTIPNLEHAPNLQRWRAIEQAKRRLLHTLILLGLSITDPPADWPALRFDFLEDQRSNPRVGEAHVTIGHAAGVLTINVAEADAEYRERQRAALGQPYRTLLGHFRHEIGHYYWHPLVLMAGRVDACRKLFGDERADYPAALTEFYANPPRHWRGQFVTAYAAAHPVEDWAECFAHFLHMTDTLDTAVANGLLDPAAATPGRAALAQWMQFTVTLNELNRSMGLADAYPFELGDGVAAKFEFVRTAIMDSTAS